MNQGEFNLADDIYVQFQTPGTSSNFFGFFDISPFNQNGNRMLAHQTAFDAREIREEDQADVGFWDLDTKKFHKLGETSSFNWQQGARLQWLPPDYETRVIYNDRGADGFHAVVVDVKSGERRRLPIPVHVVHPDGRVALSVNYERMQGCRPSYSYAGSPDPKWDVPVHPDDGIHRVDLKTGAVDQLISTAEVVANETLDAFDREPNWLMHPVWSPGGDRFAFLHRWNDPQRATRERLYTADADGGNLHMFPDTQLYTHLTWRDAETLTVWGLPPSRKQRVETIIRNNKLSSKFIMKIYNWARLNWLSRGIETPHQGVGLQDRIYMNYTDNTDTYLPVAPRKLITDGHPTWNKSGNTILTDTYGNPRDLITYNIDSGSMQILGKFVSNPNFKCDLHPRWDRQFRKISVDIMPNNTRKMVVLNYGAHAN